MSEIFKFALSPAVGAGGLEKESVMYYGNWGTGGHPGEPIHRNASGSDPAHKNPLDVIERVRQRLPGKDAELS